ncbi:STING ER exit protein [Dispira simplex]|nr:STING ER exit protein [Dispira simplex]
MSRPQHDRRPFRRDRRPPRQRKDFHVYYCLCGEYSLILEKPLDSFPKRNTDQAYTLDNTKTVFKWNVKQDEPIIIQREQGYEQQLRYLCPRCDLWMGYKAQEESYAGDYTYILPGGLTEKQGAIPAELREKLDDSADVTTQPDNTLPTTS